jgi:hypothetical protein
MEPFDFLAKLWHAAETAGPFGTLLCLYLFLNERKRHDVTRSELKQSITEGQAILRRYGDREAINSNIFGELLDRLMSNQKGHR